MIGSNSYERMPGMVFFEWPSVGCDVTDTALPVNDMVLCIGIVGGYVPRAHSE